MTHSPTVEILLRHSRFVQGLARGLLRDEHAAEDLAQETSARWLQLGSTGVARPRAWLSRVARNLAFNHGTAARRRRAREEASARAEGLPSAAVQVEQAELLHAVSAAVLELEEPYRSTLLARYYRGLDARRLAEESRTPLATVRSREQRALEKLRERLDREHGERERWALALGRLVLPGAVAASTALFPFAVAACVGSLGLWGWILWGRGTASEPGQSTVVESAPAVGVSATPSEPSAAVPAPSARVAATGPSSAGASARLAQDPALAEVRGRFVLEDGSPAAETVVRLSGFSASTEREQRFGLPQDWQDPVVTTDEQGSFSMSFVPPGAFQFSLQCERPGCAAASWWWHELRAGTTKDIGQVVLYRGGVIEGRLLDQEGQPLSGAAVAGWRARSSSVGLRNPASGREETRVSADVGADGRFRLEGLYPGQNALSGRSAAARIDGPNVRVEPGGRSAADLVYRGPDLLRRVTISVFEDTPAPPDVPPAASFHLLGFDRPARELEGWDATYVFDGVEPGLYTLVLDDPRCKPWRKDDVRPGVPLNVQVAGSAALALSVLEEDGLTPVPAFEVRLRPRASQEDEPLHDGSAPLEGGILAGIFPGDYTLTVLAPGAGAGRPSARASVDDLAPGEVRAVTLRLASSSHVAGRVLRSGGAPVSHARVRLIRPALQGDSNATSILPATGAATTNPERFRHELTACDTDAQGAFRLETSGPGPYLLEASQTESRAFSAVFPLAADESREDLELFLGAAATLRGRVLGPPGAAYAGLSLSLRSVGDGSFQQRFAAPALEAPLAGDGTFEFEGAPEGNLELSLSLPGANPDSGSAGRIRVEIGAHRSGDSGERLLGQVELAPGATLERDFDARAFFPGAVAVSVDLGGEPADGVRVAFLPQEASGSDRASVRGARTDAQGKADPVSLFPGTWDVFVFSEEGRWLLAHPEAVVVAPGSALESVVSVRRRAGTLTCVDAADQALADAELQLSDGQGRWALSTLLKTDSTGRLELSLAPGTYRLRWLTPEAIGLFAEVHWTDPGPAEPVVRF